MALKTSTRRAALALAAGTSLILGVAACSEAEDAADKATSAASDATSAAGSAVESATAENSAEEESGSAEESEGAESGEDEATDSELPADIQTLWDNEGGESGALGELESITSGDKGTLATFANGWVTHSEETGAVKLVGKIGETWSNGGGLDNEIGLPTAPEKGDAANGWTQSFQNGTITWAKGDNGEYTDTVEKN